MALLFKKTPLQSTFGAILLALDGGKQPGEFTLKDLLSRYRDHRLEVIRKRSRFDLEKAEAELHIDARAAPGSRPYRRHHRRDQAPRPTGTEAAERLQHRFGLSDVQADAILKHAAGEASPRWKAISSVRSEASNCAPRSRNCAALLGDEALPARHHARGAGPKSSSDSRDKRRTVILPHERTAPTSPMWSRSVADEDVVVTLSRPGIHQTHPHAPLSAPDGPRALRWLTMDRFAGDYLERVHRSPHSRLAALLHATRGTFISSGWRTSPRARAQFTGKIRLGASRDAGRHDTRW